MATRTRTEKPETAGDSGKSVMRVRRFKQGLHVASVPVPGAKEVS